MPESLDADTMQIVVLVALGVLALLAFLVMRMIQKMVLRVIFLGLFAGLGLFLWTQRAALADCAETCDCTFAGRDVELPDAARAACDGERPLRAGL